ncbi:MAG: Ig-like domain-containing protein [Clostridia bacterium]|nr:Ig-like domain-containing protein [Clostridia bacterium]
MRFTRGMIVLLAILMLVCFAPVFADELNVFELSVENGEVVDGAYRVEASDILVINVTKSGEWEDATVEWSSSNAGVAYVNQGIVYAQVAGTCTITATATVEATQASISASIRVQVVGVEPDPTVVTVRASGGVTTVERGGTLQLLADVTPAGIGVEWDSSRPAVISVDDDGLLTGIKSGKSIITATATDGSGASDSIVITVEVTANSVTVKPATMTLYVGGTTKKLKSTGVVKYAIKPAAADDGVTWKSSDTSVATVGAKGKVTAHKRGRATITATASNGLRDTCVVTVYKLPTTVWLPSLKKVYVNKKLNLGNLLKINGDITKVKWASSNKKIAKVNSKGVVLGIRQGTCRIIVKAVNGKSDACVINVYASKGGDDEELIDDEGIYDDMPTDEELNAD